MERPTTVSTMGLLPMTSGMWLSWAFSGPGQRPKVTVFPPTLALTFHKAHILLATCLMRTKLHARYLLGVIVSAVARPGVMSSGISPSSVRRVFGMCQCLEFCYARCCLLWLPVLQL